MDLVYTTMILPGNMTHSAENDDCVMKLFKTWYPVVGLELGDFLQLASSTLQGQFKIDDNAWRKSFLGKDLPDDVDVNILPRSEAREIRATRSRARDIRDFVREHSLEDQAYWAIRALDGKMDADEISEAELEGIANELWVAAKVTEVKDLIVPGRLNRKCTMCHMTL